MNFIWSSGERAENQCRWRLHGTTRTPFPASATNLNWRRWRWWRRCISSRPLSAWYTRQFLRVSFCFTCFVLVDSVVPELGRVYGCRKYTVAYESYILTRARKQGVFKNVQKCIMMWNLKPRPSHTICINKPTSIKVKIFQAELGSQSRAV